MIPQRPLDDSYLVRAFADADEVAAGDVIALWAKEGVVGAAEAERRIQEVLLVATHVSGALAGVSSAYIRQNTQLRMDLWHYRTFVATAHRKSNVAIQMALQGRDLLEHRFVSGLDRRASGMIYEIENEGLKRAFPTAVWPSTQFTFIGENARGDHVRVRYFPGALAPPPGA